MGAIGGLFGLSGGANGTGFSGPTAAPITAGTNGGQLQTAYGGAQNSLQSQQALLQALQAQNGLGNQSQVYNQLQGVANGTGPNPAQAMLNQATGANTANQAALMAGQRGASSNVGLIAREATQQGAANQQNAIGQGASLQANQSLNAIGQAGNLANTQAAQQIGATTANTQAQQSEQQILQNANTTGNNANVAMQGNINNVNAGLSNTTMQGQQGLIGGGLGALGKSAATAAPAAAAGAEGGMVSKYASGGFIGSWPGADAGQTSAANISSPQFGQNPGAAALQTGVQSAGSSLYKSLNAPPAASPTSVGNNAGSGFAGSDQLSGDISGSGPGYSMGGNVGSKLKAGGGVPGKAKVNHDSYANDNVKALLSPGELVVDKNTMNDQGPAGQAARFLAAAIAAKKSGKK